MLKKVRCTLEALINDLMSCKRLLYLSQKLARIESQFYITCAIERVAIYFLKAYRGFIKIMLMVLSFLI